MSDTLKDMTDKHIAIIKHKGNKQLIYDMTRRKLTYYD